MTRRGAPRLQPMTVTGYLDLKARRRQAEAAAQPTQRAICPTCHKAARTCYCQHIRPFTTGPLFVLLIHPKELRGRVGTGRLTHLCIRNSRLVEGIDFTRDPAVNALLLNPTLWPVVLYPGPSAMDVGADAGARLDALVPPGRQLVVFVIDGSWACAKKMLKASTNLQALPQIRFTPPGRSIYQIRRQPAAACLSSLEAVHFLIGTLNASSRWRSEPGHDNLIDVFRRMIEQQLGFVERPGQKATRGLR